MKKRWAAALLVLALAFALLPAPARAAGADYSAGARLTGAEREVYEYVRAEAARVAVAQRTDTAFRIPDTVGLSWTLEELGVAADDGDGIKAGTRERTADILQRAYVSLIVDCPYELFWDGHNYSVSYTLEIRGNRVYVTNLVMRLGVSANYRGDSDSTTNPFNLGRAGRALDNAKEIVERHRDKSDYDKLVAYRDEICRLVSFNKEASQDGAMPYGDPWQMVYVFDLDPSTNVVCEGYAKAFKYLCDLSRFEGDVACRIVTGTMNDGAHMWNVVRMGDGKDYLVDVANSDTGSVGENGRLFLSGGISSAGGQTYTISNGPRQEIYTYDPEIKGMYADGYLPLSSTDYDAAAAAAVTPAPSAPPTPAAPPEPAIPAAGTAYPSAQTVDLDGALVEFQMYALRDDNGNPTNYVKVRDLALALNGTEAQFNVSWDGVVNLVAGAAYTANGTENSTPFSGNQPYTLPDSPTRVNGAESDLAAFTLTDSNGGGYTYYQLRDLGQKLGFNVRWDSGRGIVCIETDKPYSG